MARGTNKKSLANLRPAKRGEVRNPEGVNTKRPATDEYWKVSGELVPEKICGRFNRAVGAKLLVNGVSTWSRAVALRANYEAAVCGIMRAARELREAMEGRAPQRLEISAAPSKVETVIIVKFEDRHGRQFETLEALHRADDEKPAN